MKDCIRIGAGAEVGMSMMMPAISTRAEGREWQRKTTNFRAGGVSQTTFRKQTGVGSLMIDNVHENPLCELQKALFKAQFLTHSTVFGIVELARVALVAMEAHRTLRLVIT